LSIFKSRSCDPAEMYDKYADMLYRLALTHTRSEEDAGDVVQDIFIKYMTLSPAFDSSEHEKAWFIRVTLNKCYDMHRRISIRRQVPLEDASQLSTQDSAETSEDRIDIMQKLDAIPEKLRSVIVLHYLEGFSVEEIADILKLSISAVKMRLSRGRDALKTQFEVIG